MAWGSYLRFLRCSLACALVGHVEPKLLHRYERDGQKARVMLRSACARCGEPLEERRSKPTQFPQPREPEGWKARDW